MGTEYTERQQKIISGETPLDSVNRQTATMLYKKAIANGDTDLAQRALDRSMALKKEQDKRNLDKANLRYHLKKEGKFEWQQPKSTDYTDRQKMIVRGEIPLEQVHTNELVNIYKKANFAGDAELANNMLSLIGDREEEYLRKQRASSSADSFDPKRKSLTYWERGIVDAKIDLSECSLEHLRHIYEVVKETEGPEVISRVERLLMYKEHPESLYSVQSHAEAIDSLEQLLDLPIRRPETWFSE